MELKSALKSGIEGEVLLDRASRIIYSQDASLYEMEPAAVVIPKNLDDLRHLFKVARDFELPLIPRGAATGTTGGCLGKGIVVDMSVHFNQIDAIDSLKKMVTVQPGIVQDDLNRALFPYRLGPDTSTGNRATLGGMLANNAAGSRSLRWGSMRDHIEEVTLLLSSGREVTLGTETEASLNEKAAGDPLFQTFLSLRGMKEEIEKRFPKSPRRVSGYDLKALTAPYPLNLAKIVAGSEGTLGLVTSMKLRIVDRPVCVGLALFFFDHLVDAAIATPQILTHHPLSLELMDKMLLDQAKKIPKLSTDWLKTVPEAMLAVECDGESMEEVEKKLLILQKDLSAFRSEIFLDEQRIASVWDVRKKGLGILMSKRTYQKASAFFEDIAVPIDTLPNFFPELTHLLERFPTSIYGHIGDGCLHLRPYIDLGKEEERNAGFSLLESIVALVGKYQGSLSGEHGDGLVRSFFNEEIFGKKLYEAFKTLKKAFDPINLMNPGKVIDGQHPLENLRHRLEMPIESTFDFSNEGGFDLSLELCNGNGQCRKKEGIMCPSFQATGREIDSTRARATGLKEMFLGNVTASELQPVFDLCLQCKGCKTECPSQVDIAKMKPEYLTRLYKEVRRPLRDYLFGYLGAITQGTFPISRWIPHSLQEMTLKPFLSLLGISKKRFLPLPASKKASESPHRNPSSPNVYLFLDTFSEFFEPDLMETAISLLKKLGFSPHLLPWRCCGRTLLSKGFLPQAANKAETLLRDLQEAIESPWPIVGLEPSCLFTLRDDLPDLVSKPFRALAKKLKEKSLMLEEFLLPHLKKQHFKEELPPVAFHTHCYQKSLIGTSATRQLLSPLFSSTLDIPSGCCGMAGSFGYEKEHYEVSKDIGELILLPTVRELSEETLLIASGTSCRHQIVSGCDKKPLHLAEALFLSLRD